MLLHLLTSTVSAAPTDGRLTDPVRPTEQTVRLNLDPAGERYEGLVEITLDVGARLDDFTLHAEGLEIQWVSVGPKKLQPATFTTDGPFLTVVPRKPLKPGKTRVEIAFAGTIATNQAGLYLTKNGDQRYLVTQFEADDARTAFPCFDEPAFKIPWTLELTTPADLVTLGNMPVTEVIPNGDVHTVRFETSPPMPSYLVALAVGPFEPTVVEGASVPITVYAPAGQAPQAAELAGQFPEHLAYLTDWFGRPLPYPKLDAVVVPDFAYGGMENVGLVVVNDGLLLDPGTTTPDQRARIAEVVAHEVAHMWFGNLVTLAWWDDLWLNESFASWMGLKSRAAVFPGNPGEFARVGRTYRAIGADGNGTMRPLRTPVDPGNVFESANFQAYPKGQAILGSTERWIGSEAFRAGLQAYMTDHAFQNATAADLFAALSAASGEDVAHILGPYLDAPGAPLVTFTATETGWKVQQERYTKLGTEAVGDTVWPVPIVYRTPAGEGRHLLDGAESTFEQAPGAWFLPVADGLGYFAWRFADPGQLEALVQAVASLTPAEQLALVENLGALTSNGSLEQGERLRLNAILLEKGSPAVGERVVEALGSVEAIVPPELDEAYSRYGTALLGPVIAALGLEAREQDTPYERDLRTAAITWLGEYGSDPAVEAHRAAQTAAFLTDPTTADLDVAADALLAHAKTQDAAFQDQMLERALAEQNPRLKNLYLRAFAAVELPSARERALGWAMEDERNLDEMFGVVFTLFSDDDLYGDAALDWAIANHDLLMKKLPPQFRGRMVGMGGGCDLERFQRAKAFYLDPAHLQPGVERIAGEVEEGVRSCITRRETYGPSLAEVLKPYATKR